MGSAHPFQMYTKGRSCKEGGVGLNDPYGSLPMWDILWFYSTMLRASLLCHWTVNHNIKAHLVTTGRLSQHNSTPTDSKDFHPHQVTVARFSEELNTSEICADDCREKKELQKSWLCEWRLCSWKSGPVGSETHLKVKVTQNINTILINTRSNETIF